MTRIGGGKIESHQRKEKLCLTGGDNIFHPTSEIPPRLKEEKGQLLCLAFFLNGQVCYFVSYNLFERM